MGTRLTNYKGTLKDNAKALVQAFICSPLYDVVQDPGAGIQYDADWTSASTGSFSPDNLLTDLTDTWANTGITETLNVRVAPKYCPVVESFEAFTIEGASTATTSSTTSSCSDSDDSSDSAYFAPVASSLFGILMAVVVAAV